MLRGGILCLLCIPVWVGGITLLSGDVAATPLHHCGLSLLCTLGVWALTQSTIQSKAPSPHRVGAWVLRALWATNTIGSGAEQALTQGTSNPTTALLNTTWSGLTLIAVLMSMAFIARQHRMASRKRLASITDLTGIYTTLLAMGLWTFPEIHTEIARGSVWVACAANLACIGALLLPTSAAQTSVSAPLP
jgi:hypothetical protein